MQYSKVSTAYLSGITAIPCGIEVVIQRGVPEFFILGASESLAVEVKMRIRCAIRSAGFEFPNEKVIVNILPSSAVKYSHNFDVPIAIGILAASGQISLTRFQQDQMQDVFAFGELTLNGDIVSHNREFVKFCETANSLYAAVICAKHQNYIDLDYFPRCSFFAIENLADLRVIDDTALPFMLKELTMRPYPSFKEIKLPESLKLEFASLVESGKSVLLFGDNSRMKPYAELAACAPALMSRLNHRERLDTEGTYQLCGEVYGDNTRPFRAPHHSINLSGMIGGGNPIYPGEITLANHGVLFLEGLQDFSPSMLEHIAIAKHDKCVHITRSDSRCIMPSDFLIVATALPCPCGNFGNPDRECTCPESTIRMYRQRILKLTDGLVDRVIM